MWRHAEGLPHPQPVCPLIASPSPPTAMLCISITGPYIMAIMAAKAEYMVMSV